MSERVTKLMNEIREKTTLLKDSLKAEQFKVGEREKRIAELENELHAAQQRLIGMQQELNALSATLSEREISISTEESKGLSDVEIDELVKEIEICITKLKA